jgi:hypothetical protein
MKSKKIQDRPAIARVATAELVLLLESGGKTAALHEGGAYYSD